MLKSQQARSQTLAGPRRRQGLGLRLIIDAALDILTARVSLRNIHSCVSVFGSGRCHPGSPTYESARRAGNLLARSGFTVITGGGSGVMEAASRGAKEAGGTAIGCNIRLVPEQEPNAYLDRVVTFRHFFTRKTVLIRQSRALIVLPGGFGTLDEVFEAAVLIQKEKLDPIPLILVDQDFWRPLGVLLDESLLRSGAATEDDVGLFHFVDTADEAVKLLLDQVNSRRPSTRLRLRLIKHDVSRSRRFT